MSEYSKLVAPNQSLDTSFRMKGKEEGGLLIGRGKFSDRRDKNVCRGGKPKMRADIRVKFHRSRNCFSVFRAKFGAVSSGLGVVKSFLFFSSVLQFFDYLVDLKMSPKVAQTVGL